MRSNKAGRRLIPKVSPVALAVLLLLGSGAFGAFGVTRNVVKANERSLLEKRAQEVAAFLRSSIAASTSTLAVLAMVASTRDGAGFEEGARALSANPANRVIALSEAEAGFTIVGVAGRTGGDATSTVAADLAALASRSLAVRQPAGGLMKDKDRTALAFAVAAPAPSGVVAVLVTAIDPSRPIQSRPGTPFSEMRAALYAAPVPDPTRVVLTNAPRLPIRGRVVHTSIDVGSDRWALDVGAQSSLSGAFADGVPWILLTAGLVVAVLISLIVHTLARRQLFARDLVEERTSKLEATRRFLQLLLDSAQTVVVRADLSSADRRLSFISPNAQRILGIDPDVIVAEGHLDHYVHVDDVEIARAATEPPGPDAAPVGMAREFRLRHGDGSYRWVSSTSAPDLDGQGHPTGVFVYVSDISDRRKAEEALRVAQRAAETANRSKSEFLSRMSHELRTPLNAVLGFGQLLTLEPLSDEQADSVDQILKGGRHLLDLINEVLDIARIEAGRLPLSPEAVLVADVVHESIALVHPLAAQRSIRLVAEDAGMLVYAFADRQRLKQILLNLLSNAVKYNHRHGTIIVRCAVVGGTRLHIAVVDTGPGIRPEQMDRLFTPFDRLDAGRTEIEGTGIGLALSRSLAEAMGGSLLVESTAGRGSTFSIDLPSVEGPVERYERSLPATRAIPQRQTGGDGVALRHKVLYIEDNLSNLKLIERILAGRGDIDVVSAIQGRLGVELARQHQPKIILLDLHLPDVTGEQVLRCLREDRSTASIPVVMVTADATAGQVQRLLSAGATAYLTKPLDVTKLLSVVDDALSRV